jgi:hypothetical protein
MLEGLVVGIVSLFLGGLASWAYSGFRLPAPGVSRRVALVHRPLLARRNASRARVAA